MKPVLMEHLIKSHVAPAAGMAKERGKGRRAAVIGVPVRSARTGPRRCTRGRWTRNFFSTNPFSYLDAGCAISRRAFLGRVGRVFLKYFTASMVMLVSACGGNPWNSPYPAADAEKNILYSAFAERPKHLDPVQSYSSNEILFTAQIYEPPLQYHYLKRPYELIPSAAAKMPVVQYFDQNGERLKDDVDPAQIAYTVYEISIKPGIRYQPHPAFARNEGGKFFYHDLDAKDLAEHI